jgi:hypothetical protein
MTQSRKIWLVLLLSVNAIVAFLWLFLYGRSSSFQFAGVHVTSGIVAVAGMLLGDALAFLLFSRKSE